MIEPGSYYVRAGRQIYHVCLGKIMLGIGKFPSKEGNDAVRYIRIPVYTRSMYLVRRFRSLQYASTPILIIV